MSDSTFDASKSYKRVCYREDRDLLSTELNEMQDAGAHDRTMILDRILTPGTILCGLAATVTGSSVAIADGVIYLDGCAVAVPGAMLSFPEPGEHTIYVDVFRRDVTASEDPTLVNPLTGEATAEREKWIATLQSRDTSSDPLPQGAKSRSVAPVYIFNRTTAEVRPAAGVTGEGESIAAALAGELASHKTSDDHDGRYFTKALCDGRFAPIGHVGSAGASQHPAATGSAAGFMSAADKTQLGNHETRITSVENTLPSKANVSDLTALTGALDAHKISSDHDGRYYTRSLSDDRFAPISHIGSGGTAQHPAATGSVAGFMSPLDKSNLENLSAEVTAARSSARHGTFGSLDARLENAEAVAIAPATYVVAAFDSIRKASAHYICDGTADQVEINQALSALPPGGGRVLLLAGTYTLSDSVEMPAGATLSGEGQATVVKLRDSHNASISLIRNKDYAHKTCISDLRIDGNRSAQSAGTVTGVEWAGENLDNLSGYHRMHNIGIADTSLGIYLRFAHSCSIAQSILSDSGGILITRISTNISVLGNVINYTSPGSQSGVVIQSEDSTLTKVSGALIAGNQMQNCWCGVHIGEGTQMGVVESNVISSCQTGISISSASSESLRVATGHLISGNSVIAALGAGMELTGAGVQSALVVGNQLVGSFQAGGGSGRGAIEVDRADMAAVQSNMIRKSAGGADHGILVKSGTTKTWVTNNDLRLAGVVSGISDAGTETITAAGNQA